MEYGIFTPTMNNGWVISKTSPQFKPDWFLMEQCGAKAEYYGFDFMLAPVKFRGFDGETEFWNYTLDSFSVMAGLAVSTSRIKLYASIPQLMLPPPVAAKMAVTINEMSGGRFGVNLVSGWEKEEYTQMGIWPGDEHFKNRYDRASEYLQVMRELWATGRSEFKGKFYQMDDCRLGPTPTSPIEVVCAGQSDRGMQFTAEWADYQFLSCKADPQELRQLNGRLKAASDKTGRKIGSYPLFAVVLRDTDEEAKAAVDDWRANQDLDAVQTLGGHASTDSAEDQKSIRNQLLGSDAFMIGWDVIGGSPQTVADKINALAEVEGTSGIMFTFQDYLVDMDKFGKEVMPLLKR
ncbi:LLM class flavin-dependent oxidoreductase [Pseudonocardia sp. NPDC046786]|uniref:LLM class flavin-dependent oxidoreductase n=1 Tax=Pseudonocardia sp. NPDC046786 TaxID=3155471 RepID=UPI0033F22968